MADFSNLVYPFLSYASTRNPYNYEKVIEIGRDFATEWIPVTLIRQQLNLIDDTSQDVYLTQLELSARFWIESYLGMPIIARSFKAYYSSSNTAYAPAFFDLPSADNQQDAPINILSFSYWNSNFPSILTILASSSYQLDPTANRVQLIAIPSDISRSIANPLEISFELDPSPLSNYPDIQHAALLMITHWYNNRASVEAKGMMPIPMGVESLLLPYKPLVL